MELREASQLSIAKLGLLELSFAELLSREYPVEVTCSALMVSLLRLTQCVSFHLTLYRCSGTIV